VRRGGCRVNSARGWDAGGLGDLGLLLILALFSPLSALPLPRAGLRGGVSRSCSSELLPTVLLDGVPRGGGRAGLLLNLCRTLPPW
jgi:hypothetical protein